VSGGVSSLVGSASARARRFSRWWPTLRPWLVAAFLATVTLVLVSVARDVPWAQVAMTLREYDAPTLAVAGGLAILGHLIYGTYDLLSARYVRHALHWPQVMAVALVSYAFNLNLGALVGGAGMRFRLYSRLGLGAGATSRVTAFSVFTNWLGYAGVLGVALAAGAIAPSHAWPGTGALRFLGGLLLGAALVYPLLCWRSRRRTIAIAAVAVRLPSVRLALLQLAASASHWVTMAAVVWVLLPERLPFLMVVGVQLFSSIVAVVVHVPAGLGVIEGTYVLLAGDRLAPVSLITALLAFRALYYLAPLAVAAGMFAAYEVRLRPRS
jgi:hypothetical protein